jgi:cysteinyl-tRNA synthetase
MMIKLYNTLTRKKETLETIKPDKLKMYVCGPTTYNYIHLGNARPVVVFDTIRRYLEYKGYNVTFVQNFTDVDDKIIKRARELKQKPLELAEKYIQEYFKDADQLNVRRADVHPRVSNHVAEIVEMVKGLIDKGYAYELEGDVYFDVRRYEGYGQLSGRSIDELKAGARVEIDTRKKDPLDFSLWKKAKPEEISWDSPWGKGRPGWHIECSAMSLKYLGASFDIHGGGYDLVFPHHENEIAQSHAYTGCGFAKYWIHNGFITINKEKMSKSLGNFFLLREILEKFPADAVRFYLLSTHYRSPLDFDDGKLEVAEKSLDRLKNFKRELRRILDSAPQEVQAEQTSYEIKNAVEILKKAFTGAMDDDFNTALAIATLFDFSRNINRIVNNPDFVFSPACLKELEVADELYENLGNRVLGLFFQMDDKVCAGAADKLVSDLMEILIGLRQKARQDKQWDLADSIRDSLKEIGVQLEDEPQKTTWKLMEDGE